MHLLFSHHFNGIFRTSVDKCDGYVTLGESRIDSTSNCDEHGTYKTAVI